MRKRVLFVENDIHFLEAWSEQLERIDFEVLKATSVEEAERLLHDHWVHLAIIDLRLRNDNDPKDTSGLTLARKDAYRAVPKIILTRFTNYNYVREALGPALEGLPPAVDYIYKLEEPEAMMSALERAFTKFVQINWELVVRWEEKSSFFLLASLLETGIAKTHIPERAIELEDLFRQLFYKSSQITLGRILTQNIGQITLEVFAYADKGQEGQFLVSCGRKEHIKKADNHYEEFAPKETGHGSTLKVKTVETMRFAATIYRLIEGDLEEISTFSQFYFSSSVEKVTTAVDYLFNTTLKPWYKKGQFREEKKSLPEFFLEGMSLADETLLAELESQIEAISRETLTSGLARLDHSSHKLILHLPDGSTVFYPNPVSCISDATTVPASTIIWGSVYGRLSGNSILTNRQGQTWLVDFSQSNRGPLIYDFVSLETTIKFELLATLNVQARYEMEKRLLEYSSFNQEPKAEDLEVEIQKALQSITCIRRHAVTLLGNDMSVYTAGLLFCAMIHLARYNPQVQHSRRELIPYLHSLLSAAMLCKQLPPLHREDLPLQAIHSLWLDEPNREVWVEGRPIRLTPQEFDFLLYLYNHQGQLCSRENIAEHVFGAEYKAQDMSAREKNRLEETRLNSTISRLRRKIEPDPETPKYITVIRGEGYKLELPSYAM